jgi:outer membrane protein OmpA-like peptidoglycan-associated protein
LAKNMTLFNSLCPRPAIYILTVLVLCGAFLSGCKKAPQSKVSATIEPTPQPFEDRILYISGGQLYNTNLAGDSSYKIPEAGKNIWFPTTSPDHSKVVYWSVISGYNELWIYDIAQEVNQQVTFFNEKITQADLQNFNVHNAPVWMADGKQIVFSHLGKLWKIDANGFNLETLIPMGTNFSPAISPDNKFLAYISEINQSRNIYIRQMTTGDEWALTKFPVSHRVGSPAWSPDGKQLAFSVSLFEKVDVWRVNLDGSDLKRLTKDGYSNSPAWSPDSEKLAFSSGRQDPYRWEIWVMNRDGSSQFSVTRNGGFSPAWIRHTQGISTTSLAPPIATEGPVQAEPTAVTAKTKPTAVPTVQTVSKAEPTAVPKSTPIPPTAVPTKIKVAKAKKPTPKPTLAPTAKPTLEPTAVPVIEKVEVDETVEDVFGSENESDKTTSTSKSFKGDEPLSDESAEEDDDVYSEYENYEEFEEYADEDESVLPEDEVDSSKAENKIVFNPEIEFYFAKDLIKPASLEKLKKLADTLNEHPDATLIVQGFMRGPGLFRKTLPILKTLSRARANSVLRHLIVNEKIRQINVTAIGAGDTFPDTSDSEENLVLLVEVK